MGHLALTWLIEEASIYALRQMTCGEVYVGPCLHINTQHQFNSQVGNQVLCHAALLQGTEVTCIIFHPLSIQWQPNRYY